jgi:hypothetical protein
MQSRHGTLTANTVATVSIPDRPSVTGVDGRVRSRVWLTLTILNRGNTAIFLRFDGVDPTVAGNDTDVVLPNSALEIPWVKSNVSVRLISSAATPYSVIVR